MWTILFDIPLKWIFNLMNDKRDKTKWPFAVFNFNIQKQYFIFGDPIVTKDIKDEWENQQIVQDIREKAHIAVNKGLKECLDFQRKDPNRYIFFKNRK
jgi:hypothetical protein